MSRAARIAPPPPPQFDSGPPVTPGVRTLYFDSLPALQAFCSIFVPPPPRGQYATSCFTGSRNSNMIALPTTKAWPSAAEIAAMARHEWGHARGWPGDHADVPNPNMQQLADGTWAPVERAAVQTTQRNGQDDADAGQRDDPASATLQLISRYLGGRINLANLAAFK